MDKTPEQYADSLIETYFNLDICGFMTKWDATVVSIQDATNSLEAAKDMGTDINTQRYNNKLDFWERTIKYLQSKL